MLHNDAPLHISVTDRPRSSLKRAIASVSRVFVPAFALLFYGFSVCFALAAVVEFFQPIFEDGDFVEGLIRGLHTGVVALAVYELAEIVHEEYDHEGQGRSQNAIARIRRGVSRFGAVVIVALVLESLIMVIKYSQDKLAGFLYYPAAIITSAALLLTALGVFAKLTAPQSYPGGGVNAQ